MWLMKDDYIQLPKTDEEINHGERLYHRIGFPGAIGYVDCVHLLSNSHKATNRTFRIKAFLTPTEVATNTTEIKLFNKARVIFSQQSQATWQYLT
jgi:hypothetical protein